MPTPSGNEQGDVEILRRRVGMDLERFRGVNKNADAAAIGRDEFQELINIEHDGQKPVSRDGLARFNAVAIGPVRGLFGTDDDSGLARVYLLYAGAAAGDVVIDADVPAPFDLAVPPYPQRPHVQSLKNGQNGVMWAVGWIPVGADIAGVLMLAEPPIILGGSLIPITPAVVAVLAVAGQDTIFDSVVEAAGRVYCGGSNQTTGDVLSWAYNASTGVFAQEEAPAAMGGVPAATTFGVFHRDEAWLGAAASNGLTRIRRRDPSTGAWSSPALPGGVPNYNVLSFEEYKNNFYVAGARDTAAGGAFAVATIMAWNYLNLAVARDLAIVGSYVAYLCANSVDGYLYYVWVNAGTQRVYVGRFDGAAWNDTYLDLTATFPAAGAICALALFEYRGDTHVLVQGVSGGFTLKSLYRHRAGVWTLVGSFQSVILYGEPLFGRTAYATF